MTKILLEIPDEVADNLRIPPDECANRVRIELSIRLYQKQILSLGKARELTQLSKWDFHELLAQENI